MQDASPSQRGQRLRELLNTSPSVENESGERLQDYLKSLRKNRESVLAVWAQKYGEKTETTKAFRRALTSLQNRTRGHLGEWLGRVYLPQTYQVTDDALQTDKIVFETPMGDRRIDVWWAERSVAVECKMGYVSANASTRRQIAKDCHLVGTGRVSQCAWLLIKGGSAKLKARLRRAGIPFQIGWPLGAPPLPELTL